MYIMSHYVILCHLLYVLFFLLFLLLFFPLTIIFSIMSLLFRLFILLFWIMSGFTSQFTEAGRRQFSSYALSDDCQVSMGASEAS